MEHEEEFCQARRLGSVCIVRMFDDLLLMMCDGQGK